MSQKPRGNCAYATFYLRDRRENNGRHMYVLVLETVQNQEPDCVGTPNNRPRVLLQSLKCGKFMVFLVCDVTSLLVEILEVRVVFLGLDVLHDDGL